MIFTEDMNLVNISEFVNNIRERLESMYNKDFEGDKSSFIIPIDNIEASKI